MGGFPIIKAENLVKKIGNKTILHGIDLHIKEGEFITVLGPNGAGKTTLLKILSLLVKPTSGSLVVKGKSGEDNYLELRRHMGVISHNSFLYDNLTAYENLEFYGKLYSVQNLKQRIDEVIEEVGLHYVLRDPVRTFSRGMLQRLSIARAIIHEPDILFLDEPYTGLDQHAIGILNSVLLNLNNKSRTLFMITHNYEQGLEKSDRILIVVKGDIVYDAATDGITQEGFKKIYLEHVEGKA